MWNVALMPCKLHLISITENKPYQRNVERECSVLEKEKMMMIHYITYLIAYYNTYNYLTNCTNTSLHLDPYCINTNYRI